MENEFFSRDRFSAKLKALRGEMSQAEVAKKLGILQQKWQRIESGKNEPDLSLLVKMSIVFKVTLSDLLAVRQPDNNIEESEWRSRALESERMLKEMDGYVDKVVHGWAEMAQGMDGIRKIRYREEA